jgi:hypothetical protein
MVKRTREAAQALAASSPPPEPEEPEPLEDPEDPELSSLPPEPPEVEPDPDPPEEPSLDPPWSSPEPDDPEVEVPDVQEGSLACSGSEHFPEWSSKGEGAGVGASAPWPSCRSSDPDAILELSLTIWGVRAGELAEASSPLEIMNAAKARAAGRSTPAIASNHSLVRFTIKP